ncbi:MAG TPA: serine kinase [Aliidongia sp.]|uniref:HPr kinase/phosphorylase n=1 Tax=Aliidongia sp. TaxID=1914230 RepID=UPI002DDCFD7F|nr:serine kinase [Aliidongia sp.]HEV2674710.1 serine kinase [Aliidongia sp.]
MKVAVTGPGDDRCFYGYRLRACGLLDFFPAWPDPAGVPDLHLVERVVPLELESPLWSRPRLSVGTDGTVLLLLEGIGRFLVRPDGEIRLERSEEGCRADVEAALVSVVAGAVLHQRASLPLHASCVLIDGRAVAITAPSGTGKSTLAAALVSAGHRLLTDDICVIRFAEDGTAMAVPGAPRLRLYDDSANAVGQGSKTLPIAGTVRDKRGWDRPLTDHAPLPLAAILRLERAATAGLERLTGVSAINPMQDIIYRAPLGLRLGRGRELFRGLTRLADKVPIYRLTRPEGLDSLAELVQLIGTVVRPT